MRLSLVLCVVAAGACRTLPTTPPQLIHSLTGANFIRGTPLALGDPRVLNAEDFVYDARLSPDAKTSAVVRLGMNGYFLSVGPLDAVRGEVLLNSYEHDVEMTEFSPDGTLVATVGRDLTVRLFDVASKGTPVAAWLGEEPLVSLAFDPTGKHLVVGSAFGRITVLSVPKLDYETEVRAHTDEVRGLAFAPDGRLFSGGWDKQVAVQRLRTTSEPPNRAHLRVEKKGGLLLFRVALNGTVSAVATSDRGYPMTVVNDTLARAAGIAASGFEKVTLKTNFGSQTVQVVKGQTLSFKGLTLSDVDVAVCESCVPPGAQLVLSTQQLEPRLELSLGADELVVRAVEAAASSQPEYTVLQPQASFAFDAFINDLTIDAAGTTLGLAMSSTKAERTRAVYEREKRKEPAPFDASSCGAFVDAGTGRVLERRRQTRTGVVATAGISPDGRSMLTGSWSKDVELVSRGSSGPTTSFSFGWAVRRARFSRDGRWASVAAWTPQNPLGNHQSDPSAVVFELLYGADAVATEAGLQAPEP